MANLQLDARSSVTLIAGVSCSGKTTFAIRHLLNAPGVVCRFVFDPRGEFIQRLKSTPAALPDDLEADLAHGWVIYDPGGMFPGDPATALRFFCEWALLASARGGGRKILLIDEVWKYCNPNAIPPELATCVQEGRKCGMQNVFTTQRPHLVNGSITNETTELVSFRLQEESALKRVEFLGLSAVEVSGLPLGTFIAVNRDSGGMLRGKVF